MAFEVITPKGAPAPLAPYVPGTKAGGFIFVSGMLALDAGGTIVAPGDVRAQTRHILEAIKAVLEAGGGTLADIVYNQIFIADLADYAAMNEVYKSYFPNPPARYCIRADLVKPEFVVEIASTAFVGDR